MWVSLFVFESPPTFYNAAVDFENSVNSVSTNRPSYFQSRSFAGMNNFL